MIVVVELDIRHMCLFNADFRLASTKRQLTKHKMYSKKQKTFIISTQMNKHEMINGHLGMSENPNQKEKKMSYIQTQNVITQNSKCKSKNTKRQKEKH